MNLLDDKDFQQKLDVNDMYERIIHLPQQVDVAYNQADIKLPQNFTASTTIKQVLFCGMGGSGISGDLAGLLLGNSINFKAVKGYNLPYCDDNTLVIAVSYSGNTAETLSCWQQASTITPHLAAVTAGGQLYDLAANHPTVKLPSGWPPRSAVAWLLCGVVKLLELYKLIPPQQDNIQKTIGLLAIKAGALTRNQGWDFNLAKQMAVAIYPRIPVFYAGNPTLWPLAYRAKCQVNENAKYPAFANELPEMNHNEIEGWENPQARQNFCPVFLETFNMASPYQKRLEAFKNLLDEAEIEWQNVFTEGESLLEQIFCLIYFVDTLSYYLAVLAGVDPTSIAWIDHLKTRI